MTSARVLPRSEGISRVFTRRTFLTQHPVSGRLAVPGKHRRWAAVVVPVAAATGLSLVPLAVSHAATPPASAPAAPRLAAAPAAALPTMTFKMNGKTVSVGGTLKSGAERIVFIVTGNSEPMGAAPTLVKLDPGVTLAQFFKVLPAAANDPNNLYGVAQIVMSAQANKGTSSVQVDLAPGTYIALDIAAPTAPPPLTVFTITRSKHPQALPKPAGVVTTIDFAFRGASKLHDGELVRWANGGFLVHMVQGIAAPNAATAGEIADLFKDGKDNQAGALATGSFAWDNGLSHGQSFQSVVSQKPGFWVIVCFFDTQDHREHTTLGMVKIIQILK